MACTQFPERVLEKTRDVIVRVDDEAVAVMVRKSLRDPKVARTWS